MFVARYIDNDAPKVADHDLRLNGALSIYTSLQAKVAQLYSGVWLWWVYRRSVSILFIVSSQKV